MDTRRTRWLAGALIGVALPGLAGVGGAAADTPKSSTGPSTSTSPYLVPSAPGVSVTSVLTVGDAVGNKPDGTPYRMVGIPDGLGAFDNGDGTFTVLMNHELGADKGITRAHGAAGAFVSKWIIRKKDLKVLKGEDLIRTLVLQSGTNTLSRLCSADLPASSAFYNRRSGKGYPGRIFMNGEETGTEGRAFAHLMDGTSYELPHLGKASFENQLANPATGDRTVVIGTDDTTPGQLYVYVGTKKSTGSPVDKAGLTGGTLFGVKVSGGPLEQSAAPFAKGTAFSLHPFGDVSSWTGATLQSASVEAGVTEFLRPEDGAWDPKHPNDFYVNTTDKFDGHSRLWRLRFADVSNPAAGGTIEALLDGTEGQQMLDNMTMTRNGKLILQEDPGNQPYLARVWQYSVKGDRLTQVAAHDPARFAAGAPGLLTTDEESSGVLDVSSILGKGAFLLTTQAHYAITREAISGELVEGGQLQVMRVHSEHDDD
ncbi:MAG: hypothetical protein WAL50_06530 [Kineosporiaceae bacterium]